MKGEVLAWPSTALALHADSAWWVWDAVSGYVVYLWCVYGVTTGGWDDQLIINVADHLKGGIRLLRRHKQLLEHKRCNLHDARVSWGLMFAG